MLFLLLLLVAYGATWLVPRRPRAGLPWDARSRWRVALAVATAVAGVTHLTNPGPFVQHLPPWVPGREPLVYATGVVELLLGPALLLPGPWRRRAGIALAMYLVAVFPANVYVAVAGVDVAGQPGGPYPWLRLPLQPVFVWLALWTTRLPTRTRPVPGTSPPRPAAPGGRRRSRPADIGG